MSESMTHSLYDKLGGQETIASVVDIFYEKVLADDRIKHFFENTNMEDQRRHQTAFISYALGGPQFTGRSMEKAHEGMNLQEQHWDAVVEQLAAALREKGVTDTDIHTIAGNLQPLKPHILHQ